GVQAQTGPIAKRFSVLFCGGRRQVCDSVRLRFPSPAMPTACSYSLPKRNSRQRFGFRRRASDKCVRDVCRPSLSVFPISRRSRRLIFLALASRAPRARAKSASDLDNNGGRPLLALKGNVSARASFFV